MHIDEFLGHFERPKKPIQKIGRWGELEYRVKCPCSGSHKNGDKNASLNITTKNGQTLVHCFAGCLPKDVLAAAGLTPKDCFADEFERNIRRPKSLNQLVEDLSLQLWTLVLANKVESPQTANMVARVGRLRQLSTDLHSDYWARFSKGAVAAMGAPDAFTRQHQLMSVWRAFMAAQVKQEKKRVAEWVIEKEATRGLAFGVLV